MFTSFSQIIKSVVSPKVGHQNERGAGEEHKYIKVNKGFLCLTDHVLLVNSNIAIVKKNNGKIKFEGIHE